MLASPWRSLDVADATTGADIVIRVEPVRGRLRSHVRLTVPLAALTAVSVIGTALAPLLGESPLLLMGLSPRLPFLAVAAPEVGLVPFLLLGTIRLCLADPFHYALGRRVGDAAVTRLPSGRLGRLLQRLADARPGRVGVGVAVLVRPNGRHLALAGATRVPRALVGVLSLVGTASYLFAVHGMVRHLR